MKEITIPEGNASNAECLTISFQNEVNLLSKLRHPNIIDYHKARENKNKLEIYMEYLPGGCLSSVIKEFGKLKKSLIIKYTRDIARVLVYLHGSGMVHRDVKCSNVLLDKVGTIKLADFGSGANLRMRGLNLAGSLTLVESNLCDSIKGSLSWMPPEVLFGDKYGRRVDVWSLGCMVFEMATSKHPWYWLKNLNELATELETHKTLDLTRDEIDSDIQSFIEYCCQYDRNSRPASSQL